MADSPRGSGPRPSTSPSPSRRPGRPNPKGLGQGIRGMAALHGRGRRADLRRGREPDARVAAAAAAVGHQHGLLRRGARPRRARRLPEVRQLRPGGDALVQPRPGLLGRARRKQGTGPPRVHRLAAQDARERACRRPAPSSATRAASKYNGCGPAARGLCEINQCDGCSTILYQSFRRWRPSWLCRAVGSSPRHRAGVASMA